MNTASARKLLIPLGLLPCATLTLWTTSVSAAPEDAQLPTATPGSALIANPDGTLDRSPKLLPANPWGWDGEATQSWDVARYLAHHKTEALRMQANLRDGLERLDPTPNQERYDQTYYDLDLTIDPSVPAITAATVTMQATVLDGPLSELELDFADNMSISSVTAGGSPAVISRLDDILTVTLDRAYAGDEEIEIVVEYSGTPTGGAFFFQNAGGAPLIWTLSQPYGARTWWPCKDYPYDKVESADIRISVPTGNKIASNGSLVSESDNGTTSFAHWHEEYPIATYLIHLGIHPYTLTTDTYMTLGGSTMDLLFYDVPSEVGNNAPINALVDDMLAAFEGLFGEYPYPNEKYGHNQFLFGGGMEHQTCSSMGVYFESIAAHEAGHQWFGDYITCKTYNHVWLNEGFATYCEALWLEEAYGPEAYLADMLAGQYFGDGTVYVPDLNDTGRIFSSGLSYNKGAWVLHMLRHVVGDATFFQILTQYQSDFAFSAADTEDFQAVCESVSGMDLDAFFTQWIYGEGFPIYTYDWEEIVPASGGGTSIQLDIEQLQDGQIFSMPIDVVVTTASGEETLVVNNTLASESFILPVSDTPLSVALDPNNWILRQLLAPIPTPTFTREILLVNGVDWDTYGQDIIDSYDARAFWGDYGIDFWDFFDEPTGGYPATLPAPRGHGAVPGDILGEYKHVIWVGNNFNGDLAGWLDTPVYAYLNAGGNVLLLSRLGDSFLNAVFQNYLGISDLDGASIFDCIAVEPGFTDIVRDGQQTLCATFDPAVDVNTTLLFEADGGFSPNRGLGAVVEPPAGGEFNPDGGKFAFLSGRPYRWVEEDLRDNVEQILATYFDKNPTETSYPPTDLEFGLQSVGPNPVVGQTEIRFALIEDGPAELSIVDVQGRRVRSLGMEKLQAGIHTRHWDGRIEEGGLAPSGIYFVRLTQAGQSVDSKITVLR